MALIPPIMSAPVAVASSPALGASAEAAAAASVYLPPPAPQAGKPEFPPLHRNLRKLPEWLRHIAFQLEFAERTKKKEIGLYFTTPAKIKVAISWEPETGELELTASSQNQQGVFQTAWKKLTAADGPMNLLLQSIRRSIGAFETSPHIVSATWRPLTPEERPWTLFQLRHFNFSATQSISLSLHVPEGATTLQWIEAFLTSLRETLQV